MSARTLLRPLALLSVVALTLSGCASAQAPVGGDASSVAPSPVAPSPTPSTPPPVEAETVDPHPAYDALIISTAGLGPLAIGVAPESNPGSQMISWTAHICRDWDPANPGRWVPTYSMPDGTNPLSVAVGDDGVGWIDVLQAGPRTAEGVGIGTDLATLQATYPNLTAGTPGPVSNVWWISDANGHLVFETQDDKVLLMRVLVPSADPDFVTANTDWLAGGCM